MDKELRRAKLKTAAALRAQQALRNNFATTDNRLDVIEPALADLDAKFAAGLLTTVEVTADVFEIEA